jgi:tetratricopeptide (TPR) repeat protein
MAKRLLLGGMAAALTAAAILLGGVLTESGDHAGADSVALRAPVAAVTGASLLPQLQEEVRAHPADVRSLGLLGLAYQQAARDTGDPTYYTKSEGVLRRALEISPDDLISTSGLGSLALSRHRFRHALALGRRAVALSPSTARGYGVLGDALVELGRYQQAFTAFNKMVSLKPSLSSYARISYARELIGDFRGASAAMKLAIESAVGEPEALAWAHTQLGKLYWNHGRVRAAEREYVAALRVRPGYVAALDGTAQVAAARGYLRRAIGLEHRASNAMPLPQYVGALGDLLQATGNKRAARRQFALIAAIDRLLRANRVKTDLEGALFDVDHAIRLPQALARARAAHRERPSIDGDDVLGWALARNGRCVDALHFSKRALRLGTQDATKFFHRGMIERCLGNRVEAKVWIKRALELNPHFSIIWSPVARRESDA